MKSLINKEQYYLKGIYKITNLINGDFYIGSTIQGFQARFCKHKSQYKRFKLGKCKKIHPYLFHAFDKYSIENFTIEVIEIIENQSLIRTKEEVYIKNLKPKYNICLEPSKGGSPNLGKKLTEEWKKRIGDKSKLYKHSVETKELKSLQNKENSSIYKVYNEDQSFIGRLSEAAIIFNVDYTTLLNTYNKTYKSRIGLNVEKLKSQKKKIEIITENDVLFFKSFGECDRYFNMWRGYTSTKVLNKQLILEKYKYKVI